MLLVLSNRDSEDRRQMIAACGRAGIRAWVMENWRVPEELTNRDDLRLYAEPLFADTVAKALSLALLEAPLDWLVSCPKRFTRRNIERSTMAEVRQLQKPVFIKALDDKQIPPRVYRTGYDLPGKEAVMDDLPVLVAEPVVWNVEVRLFVLGSEVKAGSMYLREGRPHFLPLGETGFGRPVERFIKGLAFEIGETLPHATVIDLGRDGHGVWSIVEINAAWASGIYASDPDGVLEVVMEASLPASQASSLRPELLRQLPFVNF